jgi:transcriptional regulator, araC family
MQHRIYTAKNFFHDAFPCFMMEKTRNTPQEFSPNSAKVGKREFYKIFYILDGHGSMLINNKSYPFSPGFVGLIHPNDLTTFHLSEEIGLYNILFRRTFIADWLDGLHNINHFFNIFDPFPDLSINHDLLHLLDANRNILAQIRKMEQEFLSQDVNSEYLLRLQLLELLIQFARLSSRSYAKKRHAELAGLIMDHLRAHLSEPVSMKQLAKLVGLSTGYLHTLFRQQTGCTIGKTLLSLRIREAKRMLRETSIPVERICYRCGFSDLSNFYKQFRLETGTVPGAWRRNPLPTKKRNRSPSEKI